MDWQGYNNAVLAFKIVMNESVKTIRRRTFKVPDAFGTIGGFMSIIFIIGLLFVSNF